MKVLWLALGLFSISAFAQIDYTETSTEIQQSVTLRDLKCSIKPGSGSQGMFTEATNLRIANPLIELKHDLASAEGCDMPALNKLVDDSVLSFGFVRAKITVIHKVSVHGRILSGQCVRNFNEQLVIDLGENVVLKTAEIFILKKANDCR